MSAAQRFLSPGPIMQVAGERYAPGAMKATAAYRTRATAAES